MAGSPGRYCGSPSPGAGVHQLPAPEAREGGVLVVTDHFTCCAQACMTQSQMVVRALRDNFVVHCVLPERILSDWGGGFGGGLVADLYKFAGTGKFRAGPCHPWMSGQCEGFGSALIGMLGALPPECRSDCRGSVGVLVHACSCAWGLAPAALCIEGNPNSLSMSP